jgi:hypothetical protein
MNSPNVYGVIGFIVVAIATVIWCLLKAAAKPPPYPLDKDKRRVVDLKKYNPKEGG